MSRPGRIRLRLHAFAELWRYDLVLAAFGFRRAYRGLKPRLRGAAPDPELEREIAQALDWAASFYWKRVRCLERSIAGARLLRAYGIPAELVIGCTLAPFVGHAWVEVGGRILSGPGGYPEKLQILDRV